MLKNLPKIVDHYDDSGAFLKEAIDGNRVPYVVKTAADLSNPSSRNDEDYALVVNTSSGKEYKYPIVDAGNTLPSTMYLSSMGSDLPVALEWIRTGRLRSFLIFARMTRQRLLRMLSTPAAREENAG